MSGYTVSTNEKDLGKFAQAIQALYNGRSNACGSVTLAAGGVGTTVSAPTVSPASSVLLFPKTAHAGAELAAGGCYVSAVARKSFTITHANNGLTDRSFFWIALG